MESVKADMSGKKKVLLPEALSDLEKRRNCEFGFDEKVAGYNEKCVFV